MRYKDLIEKNSINDHGAEKSTTDLNKIILRIDELENENMKLSNKLDELTTDHAKLTEHVKFISNYDKNIISHDGGKYEGDWVNNKRYGKGTITYTDGSKYKGSWRNGKRQTSRQRYIYIF